LSGTASSWKRKKNNIPLNQNQGSLANRKICQALFVYFVMNVGFSKRAIY